MYGIDVEKFSPDSLFNTGQQYVGVPPGAKPATRDIVIQKRRGGLVGAGYRRVKGYVTRSGVFYASVKDMYR
jgi:hypothetical protein